MDRVTPSTIRLGDIVKYRDEVKTVKWAIRRPRVEGGHAATVYFTDGTKLEMKPGHFLPKLGSEVDRG